MRGIIYVHIIHQLLYFTSNVESLEGSKVVSAHKNEFPFIASIQYTNGEHFCSGSLITVRHILTAAHCLEGEQPCRIRIALGLVDSRNATVRYRVAPWHTYNDWAGRLRIPGAADFHDIAVIPLLHKVNQPNARPIRLSELNKQQVQGKTAVVLGWDDDNKLKKAIINIVNDKDCIRNILLITNDMQHTLVIRYSRILCTTGQPNVLLQDGDSGGPLLDQHGALLGIHYGIGPKTDLSWGNFSEEFLQGYQVNLHPSIDYYRHFIVSVTDLLLEKHVY